MTHVLPHGDQKPRLAPPLYPSLFSSTSLMANAIRPWGPFQCYIRNSEGFPLEILETTTEDDGPKKRTITRVLHCEERKVRQTRHSFLIMIST